MPRDRKWKVAGRPARSLAAVAAMLVILFAAPLAASPERGSADEAAMCDHAAARASERWGVPIDVLRAIALTETGRKHDGAFRPWPWTVNMEGKGVWFDSAEQAKAYVQSHHVRGARSYDVGCFQLNYRWHGHEFASLDAMFDPATNADYAARFLSELHAEFGDWNRAAGAYHSRTPEFAAKYRSRFERIRARVAGTPLPEPDAEAAQVVAAADPAELPASSPVALRVNSFPLLQGAGRPISHGSLVPLSGAGSTRRLVPAG